MDRVGNPPKTSTLNIPPTDLWFSTMTSRMNVYSGSVNPVVTEIPENQWIVFRNTTSGEVRIWTNIAGVLRASAAFT